MYHDLEKTLVMLLTSLKAEYSAAILHGNYDSLESYKYAVGFVNGISSAFDAIEEAKRLLKLDTEQLEEME